MINSQNLETTEVGGERGYDAGNKVNGRKRHIAVDTLGLVLAMHPATFQDYHRVVRASRITVIAALGLTGVRAPLAFPGATDTATFQTYVDMARVPELRVGDVVVFDKLSPHLTSNVVTAIKRAGA